MTLEDEQGMAMETPATPDDVPCAKNVAATPEFVLATPTPPQVTPDVVLETPSPLHLEVVPEDNSKCSSFELPQGHVSSPAQTEDVPEDEDVPVLPEDEDEDNHSYRSDHTPVHDASSVQHDDEVEERENDTPIFIPRMPALLPSPSPRSTPPRRPTARRKTLAGVTGFQLPRQSPRIAAKKRKMPISKLAEQLLCRRMGVLADEEQVTETAIAKFADMFQGRLPDIAVAALRALFQLDCDLSSAVEEALMQHGGEGGPDTSAAASTDA